jgi:multicomponent Na+:H+ antiporter subunit G
MTVQEIIAIVLASAGLIFMFISAFGIIRLPDFYTRLHAAGIGDTLGAMLIFAAMIVMTGFKLISLKILILILVIMLTNPMGTNMIILTAIKKNHYLEDEMIPEKGNKKEEAE